MHFQFSKRIYLTDRHIDKEELIHIVTLHHDVVQYLILIILHNHQDSNKIS